jgi:ADP-ribose pyrophosphatase YjhB (NUDIX family)
MNTQYLFMYCQKLIVFSADRKSVLFARRKDEADFDQYWSLIGGKLEVTDGGILPGIKREKDEEVGERFHIKVAPQFSCYNVHYQKKDGTHMILPHYIAMHIAGEVRLNEREYSEYKWVSLDEVEAFGPKVNNTSEVIKNALKVLPVLTEDDFVEM